MIYKLLQHGHNARLEKHSEGWKIVLTLDGVYFDEAAAQEALLYWQQVLTTSKEIGLITKQGEL